MPTPPMPTPPAVPTSLTVTTIAAYAGSVAVFIVGVLTACGVPIPVHLSGEVQTVVAAVEAIVGGVVGPVITTITHHNTVAKLAK